MNKFFEKFNYLSMTPRVRMFTAFAPVILGGAALWYSGADNYQKQWAREGGPFSDISISDRKALGQYVPVGFNYDLAGRYNKLTALPPSSVPVGNGSVSGELEKLIQIVPSNGNAVIEKLKSLSLGKAEEYAQDLINYGLFFDKFKQMEGHRQLELGAAIIFALRENGMMETEKEFQAWLVQNYKPDSAYDDWLAPRMENLVAEISGDKALMNNFAQWKKRYQYQDINDAEGQFYLRQGALQNISDKVLSVFGYDPVPVMLSVNASDIDLAVEEKNAARLLQAFAYHNDRVKGSEFILVNYFDHSLEYGGENSVQDIEKVMNTILEEAKHITDILLMHDLFEGKLNYEDPRYAHALAIYINYSGNYEIVDPSFNKSDAYNRDAYYNQYVERTAKSFAEEVKSKVWKINKPVAGFDLSI